MQESSQTSGSRPVLQASSVAWAVGDRFVLLDADLSIFPGECLALTGDNGAGKSTLLDLLAAVRTAQAGEIRLYNTPLSQVEPAEIARRIARLGHKPGLYLDLSACENLILFEALQGRQADKETIAARLGEVGILPADQHRPVRAFSRGMLQRTALGRIVHSQADVWLLDEPSTGLDASGLQILLRTIEQACAQGTAVVLASHDPPLIQACSRRVRVSGGRVLAEAA